MRALSLFSGYGGIDLALKEYISEVIAYVEIEEYCQKIIAYRMADGTLKRASILADVKNVRGSLGICDIIYGGFPCQDLSVAGNGKGLAGERSGLFYEIIRLTKEIRPSFVFLENVPAIRTRGLEQVIKEFTKIGYDCRWTCLSAASVGANHKRERWFLLAHSNGNRNKREVGKSNGIQKTMEGFEREKNSSSRKLSGANHDERDTAMCGYVETDNLPDSDCNRPEENLSIQARHKGESILPGNDGSKKSLAYSMREGLEGQWEIPIRIGKKFAHACNKSWWSVEPDVGRVANGSPFRVDRVKALGNGVVPLQVKTAFEKLIGI